MLIILFILVAILGGVIALAGESLIREIKELQDFAAKMESENDELKYLLNYIKNNN